MLGGVDRPDVDAQKRIRDVAVGESEIRERERLDTATRDRRTDLVGNDSAACSTIIARKLNKRLNPSPRNPRQVSRGQITPSPSLSQ